MTQTTNTVDTKAFVDYLTTILNGNFNTMYVEGYCGGYQMATGHNVWIDTNVKGDEWVVTIYGKDETVIYEARTPRNVKVA